MLAWYFVVRGRYAAERGRFAAESGRYAAERSRYAAMAVVALRAKLTQLRCSRVRTNFRARVKAKQTSKRS